MPLKPELVMGSHGASYQSVGVAHIWPTYHLWPSHHPLGAKSLWSKLFSLPTLAATPTACVRQVQPCIAEQNRHSFKTVLNRNVELFLIP